MAHYILTTYSLLCTLHTHSYAHYILTHIHTTYSYTHYILTHIHTTYSYAHYILTPMHTTYSYTHYILTHIHTTYSLLYTVTTNYLDMAVFTCVERVTCERGISAHVGLFLQNIFFLGVEGGSVF